MAAVTRPEQVEPAYAASGSYIAAPAAVSPAASKLGGGDNLPAAPTVLERFKDSGKPLP